jgi:hypothetical protein
LAFAGAGCAFEFRSFSFFIVTSGFGWTARSSFVASRIEFMVGIGGAADMDGQATVAYCVENDPSAVRQQF